jgi:hypothetical protein
MTLATSANAAATTNAVETPYDATKQEVKEKMGMGGGGSEVEAEEEEE